MYVIIQWRLQVINMDPGCFFYKCVIWIFNKEPNHFWGDLSDLSENAHSSYCVVGSIADSHNRGQ